LASGGPVLGIDTSTFWLNLALADSRGRLLAQRHEWVKTHTTHLASALEALLKGAGVEKTSLAALGVVTGPGSFTGLRVGLAAAAALGQALGLPAFGLDSLTALAACADAEGEGVALLDARRSQVYAATFLRRAGRAERLSEIRSVRPEEVLSRRVPAWAIGDGVALVPSWPEGCWLDPDVPNLAVPAARAALERLRLGEAGERLTPLYVRPPDVRMPGS
jgi:tRNA threonylcarbamoyladenosine biosynthesis protein TsaB